MTRGTTTAGARPRRLHRWTIRLLAVAVVPLGLPTLAGSAQAAGPCDAPVVNKVACENTLSGTPESQWRVTPDPSIVGYTTDISTNLGSTVQFKVKTSAPTYNISIYRLGWYGGDGARLVHTISNVARQSQPACITDATGLFDCGNWAVSASWTVPTSMVSGLYYAVLHRNNDAAENEVFFVVRDDADNADMLFQTSDTTWQAYNRYDADYDDDGLDVGSSLYSGIGPGPGGSAWMVSYNRPLQASGDENLPFNAEYPMIRFLESNGYDVTYQSGVDTDRLGVAELTDHKVFLSVGHDEYWSGAQRANVEAAKAAGVHLGFFAGNEMFWKVRYQPSADSSATPYRTMVCYKETKANAKIDPNSAWTGTWRDPRFSPPSDGGRPENALIGQQFLVNGRRDDALQVPATYGRMRLWRGTALASLPLNQTYTFAAGTLGYEWDTYVDNGSQPAGVAQLSRTTVTMSGQYILQNYGDEYAGGTATHSLTLYKDQSSGALVFGAGTVQWPWGLDDYHDFQTGTTTSDVRIKQATVNLFADMGVQPATRQAGLTAATASTDTTAPTATIGTPSPATPVVGVATTFTGTVADASGQVGGVEVSVDGGSTWHPASWQAGSSTWSYAYTPNLSGNLTVKVRAVDDSANLSTPVSRSFTVNMRDCPCSLWSSSTAPGTPAANDSSAVELGMRFRSDVAGYVRGVRFYKGTGNTGTHTGSLWTTSGQLLKTGTFSGETTTGWQTLTFPQAVAISANTDYIVSYHTNTGRYAADLGYFASQPVRNEPLTAPQSTGSAPNGMYRAGASGFPDSSYNATNYWVDVVFALDPGPDTLPPNVAGRSPAPGTPNAALTGTVTATFDEPVTAASLQFTVKQGSTAVPGSVSLNGAGTVATFTPTSALAGGTGYDVSVRAADPSGNLMAAADTWSFTTGTPRPAVCPCTVWDDFTTPAVVTTADSGPIELGTKVRFDTNGWVTGIRFFKGTQNTGTHTGTLWSSAGTQLRTGTFSGETASGWQTLTFASPVQVTANTTYVVSYHTNTGFYSSSPGYFGNQGADYQTLHALRSGVDGGNGLYRYGTSGFPTGSYNSTNYWVDVQFTNSLTGDTTPPQVTGRTPATGATGVSLATAPTATFNEAIDPATLQFTLRDGGGAYLTGAVAYNAGTKTATLTPAAPLVAGATYTASVRAADESANLMTAAVIWSFTTTTVQVCPCSLFSAATVPTVPAAADTGAYELGVRFTSSVAGTVTGVRFYKGAGNTGTHTGSLWTSTGTLLATGTFTNETATGWQTLTFPTPVEIAAGTAYVASYTDPAGRYSADTTYFEQGPATSVPLTAPATGAGTANGVYQVGTGFPTNTFRGTNYWVDVVVTTVPGAGSGASAALRVSTTALTSATTPPPWLQRGEVPRIILPTRPVVKQAPSRRGTARRQRRRRP